MELHGDRGGLDDPAMVCGIGSMDGVSFMFIGHQKGRNTKVAFCSVQNISGTRRDCTGADITTGVLHSWAMQLHREWQDLCLACFHDWPPVAHGSWHLAMLRMHKRSVMLRRRTSTGTSACPSLTAIARRCGS